MTDASEATGLVYDVSSIIHKGARDYQEDAFVCDFSRGASVGFVVLSDGMGGHAAGDMASKIVVTEVFSELKFQTSDPDRFVGDLHDILLDAVAGANECINAHSQSNPETAGMGATVVVPVFHGDKLSWISVGDSPLYLIRNGEIRLLNEDHSLAPQIDLMADAGLLAPELARNHPDRSCLTSVLIGESIEKIDCPEDPTDLRDGDVILAASDGLQTLTNDEICGIVTDHLAGGSAKMSDALLEAVLSKDDPNQDNIAFCVIVSNAHMSKFGKDEHETKRRRSAEIVPLNVHGRTRVATDLTPSSAKGGTDT